MIVAVDPGSERSAVVVVSQDGKKVSEHWSFSNDEMLSFLWFFRSAPRDGDVLVLEQIASYGMPVGAEVFDTVFWSGRFAQEWKDRAGTWDRLKRQDVKLTLCGSARAKDANVRQALIDRFGPGKEKAIGTKKAPGPLYGIHGDEWAALAVAVAYAQREDGGKA